MKPNSLSASSIANFENCPAKWIAESHHKAPGGGGSAANLGTSVHNALEEWVKSGLYKDPTSTNEQLRDLFKAEYFKLFGTDHSRLDEGAEMCKDWYERNHPWPEGREVISTEVKTNFMLSTSIGDIPVNYIWDRCDRVGNDIDVVDYKTIMRPLSPDQMREKIQPRLYAVAAALQFQNEEWDTIWVTYDMLRHGDPVSVSFRKDDLRATYDYISDVAERIIAMDINDPPEKINNDCMWCIRKGVCKTLQRHADVGGIMGTESMAEIVERRAKAQAVTKALKKYVEECDDIILGYAEKEDVVDFELDEHKVAIRARKTRNIDGTQVKRIVPDDVWEQYGKESLSMAAFDKMMKDTRLDDDTKRQLKGLLSVKVGNPFVITEAKNPMDED